MDIKNDDAILSISRKCGKCLEIYEISQESELTSPAICSACSTPENSDSQNRHKRNFKTLPSSGYSSLLPYQIPQVKEFLESVFPFDGPTPLTIVDATAHIGGDCIHFSKIWPLCKITAIDIDENAIRCLETNIKNNAMHPENFEVVHADCTEWIKTNRKEANFYYLDPPWGGPNYSSEDEISLFLGSEKKPVVDIINFILDENLAPQVLLKVPRNFTYATFKKEVHGTTKLHYIKKPQKRGSIAYALILISK